MKKKTKERLGYGILIIAVLLLSYNYVFLSVLQASYGEVLCQYNADFSQLSCYEENPQKGGLITSSGFSYSLKIGDLSDLKNSLYENYYNTNTEFKNFVDKYTNGIPCSVDYPFIKFLPKVIPTASEKNSFDKQLIAYEYTNVNSCGKTNVFWVSLPAIALNYRNVLGIVELDYYDSINGNYIKTITTYASCDIFGNNQGLGECSIRDYGIGEYTKIKSFTIDLNKKVDNFESFCNNKNEIYCYKEIVETNTQTNNEDTQTETQEQENNDTTNKKFNYDYKLISKLSLSSLC